MIYCWRSLKSATQPSYYQVLESKTKQILLWISLDFIDVIKNNVVSRNKHLAVEQRGTNFCDILTIHLDL